MFGSSNVPGTTPRKVKTFNADSPPNKVERASPQWKGITRAPILKTASSRKESSERRRERHESIEVTENASSSKQSFKAHVFGNI
jgi:hypothetical protein